MPQTIGTLSNELEEKDDAIVHSHPRPRLGDFRFVDSGRWPSQGLPFLLALTILFLGTPEASAQSAQASRVFEGKARIVDGDTLEIGIQRIDLHGIDAPEMNQFCERDGRQWRCGMEATYAMAALLETQWVTCRQRAIDTEGNLLVDCRMGGPKGISVNQEFVRQGWALAVRPAGNDYIAAEQEAKSARTGLWSGTLARRGSGGAVTKQAQM
jgi:endonuclease YncB( thermonuclease family)